MRPRFGWMMGWFTTLVLAPSRFLVMRPVVFSLRQHGRLYPTMPVGMRDRIVPLRCGGHHNYFANRQALTNLQRSARLQMIPRQQFLDRDARLMGETL